MVKLPDHVDAQLGKRLACPKLLALDHHREWTAPLGYDKVWCVGGIMLCARTKWVLRFEA